MNGEADEGKHELGGMGKDADRELWAYVPLSQRVGRGYPVMEVLRLDDGETEPGEIAAWARTYKEACRIAEKLTYTQLPADVIARRGLPAGPHETIHPIGLWAKRILLAVCVFLLAVVCFSIIEMDEIAQLLGSIAATVLVVFLWTKLARRFDL
jgi:hypothetical protein